MNNIGIILKEKREFLKLSVPDVASVLKIKSSYIQAFELGEAPLCPLSRVYIIGWLKSYSKILGLSENEIIKEYKENLEIVEPPKSDRGVIRLECSDPDIYVMILSAIFCIFVYYAYNIQTGQLIDNKQKNANDISMQIKNEGLYKTNNYNTIYK